MASGISDVNFAHVYRKHTQQRLDTPIDFSNLLCALNDSLLSGSITDGMTINIRMWLRNGYAGDVDPREA